MRLPPVVITVLSIGCVLIFWPDFHENFHQMGRKQPVSQVVLKSAMLLVKSGTKPVMRVFAAQEEYRLQA